MAAATKTGYEAEELHFFSFGEDVTARVVLEDEVMDRSRTLLRDSCGSVGVEAGSLEPLTII